MSNHRESRLGESTGAGDKPAPLTNAQKQHKRVSDLDIIAQALGWWNIGTALTAIKNGVVKLPRKPRDYNDIPARANGKRGGRPKRNTTQ